MVFDSAGLKKIGDDVGKLAKHFTKTESELEKFINGLKNMVSPSALGLKAVNAIKDGFISLTKEMMNNYNSAAKLSQNIDITAESVLGLRHAAELSGVGAEKTYWSLFSGIMWQGKKFYISVEVSL